VKPLETRILSTWSRDTPAHRCPSVGEELVVDDVDLT
jgi:hypothetical protein